MRVRGFDVPQNNAPPLAEGTGVGVRVGFQLEASLSASEKIVLPDSSSGRPAARPPLFQRGRLLLLPLGTLSTRLGEAAGSGDIVTRSPHARRVAPRPCQKEGVTRPPEPLPRSSGGSSPPPLPGKGLAKLCDAHGRPA